MNEHQKLYDYIKGPIPYHGMDGISRPKSMVFPPPPDPIPILYAMGVLGYYIKWDFPYLSGHRVEASTFNLSMTGCFSPTY